MSVQPVRRRTTRSARLLAALAVGGLLLLSAALPAAAKEFLNARLEAPISFDSPPGSELLVAVIVTVPEGINDDPVDGSPIWLRLTGPTGDVTEAPGVMGSGPGRYEMRIRVPEGGPREPRGDDPRLERPPDLPHGGPLHVPSDRGRDRPARAAARHDHPGAARGRIRHPRGARRPRCTRDRCAGAGAAPWPAIALGLAAGIVVAAGLAVAMRRSRSAGPAPSAIDAPRAPGA